MMFEDATPCVSVIMPIYDTEAFVSDAIRSVLMQSFVDFELIIVDDGATDRSLMIAQSFTDERIRIVRQAHRGRAGARNTGILHARGKYVALLDSFDMWAPDKLDLHVAHLESDEDLGASTSGAMLIDLAGDPLGITQRPKTGPISARDVFCGRVVVNGSAPVFRWEMLIESALPEDSMGRHWVFDERLRRSEDMECWTRLAVTSRFRFETIDRPLTYHRVLAYREAADATRQLEAWEEAYEKIAHIAPDFVAECGDEARALQMRLLARDCVRTRERGLGLAMLREAVAYWPALLWQEPGRTAATFLACLAALILPRRGFGQTLLAGGGQMAGVLAS